MNVLFLGISPSPVVSTLKKYRCEVFEYEDPIEPIYLEENEIEFAVSYRYRHIVKRPIIEYLEGKIINLHISLLPWNRGSDPNQWSFLEDTPKGVTIHCIDEGLDTGDILVQKEVEYNPDDTLRTSYNRLSAEIEDLFQKSWPDIQCGRLKPYPQYGLGSFHRISDRQTFEYLLTNGWDTPVKNLIGKAKYIKNI